MSTPARVATVAFCSIASAIVGFKLVEEYEVRAVYEYVIPTKLLPIFNPNIEPDGPVDPVGDELQVCLS